MRINNLLNFYRGGYYILFTNGCFDILHAGHVDMFRQMKLTCEEKFKNSVEFSHGMKCYSVVGVNTDASVRKLKGESRPVNSLELRKKVLCGLRDVDLVIDFDEDTPLELIKVVKPNLMFKGNDYAGKFVAGADEIKGWGGELILVPFNYKISTTEMILKK